MNVPSTSSLAQAASSQPGHASDRPATPETSGAGNTGPEAWRTPLESPVVPVGLLAALPPPGSSTVAQGPQQEPAATFQEAHRATGELLRQET